MSANGKGNGNGNGERMTRKQAAFVDHWIDTRYNGTQAAKLAGYGGNEHTLAQIASQNLRKLKIQAAIQAKLSGHGASAELVIKELLDIALHADVSLLFEGGALQHDKLKEYGRFVKSVHKTKDGWRVEVYSRVEVLKELSRILKAGGVEEKAAWEGDVNVYFKGELAPD